MGVIIQNTEVTASSTMGTGSINVSGCTNAGFNRKLVMVAIQIKDPTTPGSPDLIFDYGGSGTVLTNTLNNYSDYGPGYFRITIGYLDNPPVGTYTNRAEWGTSGVSSVICWCLSNAKTGINIAADSESSSGVNGVNFVYAAGDIGDLILTSCSATCHDGEGAGYFALDSMSGAYGVTKYTSVIHTNGAIGHGHKYYPNKGTETIGWSVSSSRSSYFTSMFMGAVGIKAAAIGKHGMHP